jgi:hypothetical protein
MKLNDPWDPLDLVAPGRRRVQRRYIALIVLLGALLLWLLLARSNAPEEGGVREVGYLSDVR